MGQEPALNDPASMKPNRRLLVWLIAGSLLPYLVGLVLLVIAFGPERGNRLWFSAAVLVIAAGLVASAALRLVVLRLTGWWATTSAPRRAFTLTFVVVRLALAVVLALQAF